MESRTAALEKNSVNISERLTELGLTKREKEVALLILKDLSNAEIAAELFISETIAKKYMTNIFGKLGIGTRGELAGRLLMTAGSFLLPKPCCI